MRIVEAMGRWSVAAAMAILALPWSAADAAAILSTGTPALLQAAAEDPVAMVVRVTGNVQVRRAEGGSAPATVGLRLMSGDRLEVASGAQAVILYVSGRRETVTQSLAIAAPDQAQRAGVFDRTVSTLNAVASSDARQQPNRQGMIRPIAGAPTLLSPRNEIRVADLRPTFTWSAVPGATSYMIQIRSHDGLTRKRFDVGSDTSWTLPASEPPLQPGVAYVWTVGTNQGRVGEEQHFSTLSAEQYAAIAEGMAELRGAGLDPWSDGLFLAALIFRDGELFYEADRALRQLEATGTSLGQPFYMLRGEVYDALGLLDAAADAFDRAAEAR